MFGLTAPWGRAYTPSGSGRLGGRQESLAHSAAAGEPRSPQKVRVERMYAVIRTGGKQYPVRQGQTVDVEKLDAAAGSEVTLDDVVLVNDGKKTKVGQPTVKGAKVTAEVVDHDQGPKVRMFKRKRRKAHKRFKGHRQPYTRLQITNVAAG